jgi:TetR/AcrR family transcriptional regulator, regulator of cefoperazone and chloramphenicol sensitivity
VLAAATDLFALRGFYGTSIRDIARHAGVNVAAGHYHYGSKKGLYLRVLRNEFAQVRTRLDQRGAPSLRVLRTRPRRELIAFLTTRIAAMVDVLLEPPLRPHGALMLREMCDPTAAMPIIVREFIEPQMRQLEALVAALTPSASRTAVRRSVYSIVGQVLFYRFTMPAMLLVIDRPAYPRGWTRQIVDHVVRFSLGGVERVARPRRRRAR